MGWDTDLLKKIFPSIVIKTNSSKIHLTFDDGPNPVATPIVLDILKKYNITATFFLLGKNVYEYPIIAKQIKLDGHQIGNHSYSHAKLLFKNHKFIYNEIRRTEEIIISTINEKTKLFRPPYGLFDWTTMHVLRLYNMHCVLWNNDSKDYKLKASEINKRFLENINYGSIVLMHDNELTSQKIKEYLPEFIETMLNRGFKFDIISI